MYKWKEVISYATQRRFLGGKETKVKRAASDCYDWYQNAF